MLRLAVATDAETYERMQDPLAERGIEAAHVRTDERRFNYSHPYTEGWGGDAVVGYSNGTASGYVFASVWDSAGDAREFREAYVALLESKGAVEVRDGVYRVPEESGYGDAFRVSLSGERLVVVNAPDVATLDEVRSET